MKMKRLEEGARRGNGRKGRREEMEGWKEGMEEKEGWKDGRKGRKYANVQICK